MKNFITILLSAALAADYANAVLIHTDNDHVSNYQFVEKKKKKSEPPPIDFSALGGLLGGLTTLTGNVIGGEAGQAISASGNMLNGVSQAAVTGDVSNITSAVANGVGGFVPNSNF